MIESKVTVEGGDIHAVRMAAGFQMADIRIEFERRRVDFGGKARFVGIRISFNDLHGRPVVVRVDSIQHALEVIGDCMDEHARVCAAEPDKYMEMMPTLEEIQPRRR